MRASATCFLLCAFIASGAGLPVKHVLATEAPTERVPFVGCPSDGQQGPTPPPDDAGSTPALPVLAARHLAYYATSDLGVLAPRGWSCFGLVGSSGSSIVVTAIPHVPEEVFKGNFKLSGPAVQLTNSFAGTSGRFNIARVAARLFPEKKWFVQLVIDEGIMSRSDFEFAPYPRDRLKRRTSADVEFETPANEDGMGTNSLLTRDGLPIEGVAILAEGEEPDLLQLVVRLPDELRRLAPVIIEALRLRGSR